MEISYNRTRWACYRGAVTLALVVNLAPILFVIFQQRYGLSYQQLGTLVLLNFVIQLTVDLICARFATRIGYRAPLVIAHGFVVVGMLLLGILPQVMSNVFAGLCVAVVFFAIGGGLIEVLNSPLTDALPTPEHAKAAQMALMHSFFCWGQLAVVAISTLALLWLDESRWWMLPIAWAVLPIFNGITFLRVPLMPMIPEENRTKIRTLLSKPLFWTMLMLMVCSGASELVVSQWASLFVEQALGLPKVWGDLLGPCLFALMMGIGRLIYGVWGDRINLQKFMLWCGALCVACYLVLCLAPSPAISLAACAMTGFSVSIFWPGTCSLTSARFPMGGAAMFAVLAAFGDLGCASGPWLAGLAADHSGSGVFGALNQWLFSGSSALKTGILTGVIFPLLLLIVTLTLGKTKKKSAA